MLRLCEANIWLPIAFAAGNDPADGTDLSGGPKCGLPASSRIRRSRRRRWGGIGV